MSGSNEGWVRLHRRFLNSPVWHNPNLARFWTWCLLKATHQPFRTMVGYSEVVLRPGQFVFTRSIALMETGLTERGVRSCLEALKSGDDPAIGQQTTSKYSIVTILKWGDYQSEEFENVQQTSCKTTSKRPAINKETQEIDPPGKTPESPEKVFFPSQRHREAAKRVIAAYEEKVKPRRLDDKMKRVEQRDRLHALFANGHTEEEMHQAIIAFAAHWQKEDGGDPDRIQWRYGFRRFFGERENLWVQYLKPVTVITSATGQPQHLDFWSDKVKDALGLEWAQRFRAKAMELGDTEQARAWLAEERRKEGDCA